MKDIRSFFGAPASTKKKSDNDKETKSKKTPTTTSKTKEHTTANKTNDSTKRKNNETKSNEKPNKKKEKITAKNENDPPPKIFKKKIEKGDGEDDIVSNKRRKVTTKALVIDSSSEDELPTRNNSSKPIAKKKIVIESDDDSTTDDEFDMKPSKNETKIKSANTTVRKKEELKEISAEDYFATSKGTVKPTKKKPDIFEMEDSDTDDKPLDVVKSYDKDENRNDDVKSNKKDLTLTLLETKEKPTKKEKTTKPSPIKEETKEPTKSSKKSKKAPIKPTHKTTNPIDSNNLTPLCLENTTFVFTGILPSISRDDATSLIKVLGGRVTSAVSSKTTYLVCGSELEDGRDVEDGKKFKTANELGEESVLILRGDGEFYGLLETLSNLAMPEVKPAEVKRVIRNPYAKKKPTKVVVEQPKAVISSTNDSNALWADKYAPTSTREILGNGDSVKKLSSWLQTWESQKSNQRFKAALLSGPPGIGKTTTAILVSKENNRLVREFNASDVRSKKILSQCLGDITGSQTLNLTKQKQQKRVIIMDEVDGMSSGDRSGISEIIHMIKTTLVPIICICNDRQSPKLKSLIPYCLDLRYRRPTKTVIARRVLEIASQQNITVEYNAIEALSESCGNDIRQVLNCMQMWNANMTYKDYKEREDFIKKDEGLRLNFFDATKMILEGKGSLYKRSDAFFTDYNFMGVSIQENYLKAMISQYQETKKTNDTDTELKVLERMASASDTMSDYAMAEQAIRGGDQNWELLPFCAVLAVKTGRHAAGEHGTYFPGYPAFASWLGKNSSKGKKQRILSELNHHMNYTISTDQRDLRCFYIPTFHTKFMKLFTENDIQGIISLMDEYGLNRDDIFENIDEFGSLASGRKFADLDSKLKASFTREYNKGSHMSQALVEEQGAGKKAVKRKASVVKELDVVDDDEVVEEEEEEGDEDVKAFMKKGTRGKGSLSSVESGKSKGKRSRKK